MAGAVSGSRRTPGGRTWLPGVFCLPRACGEPVEPLSRGYPEHLSRACRGIVEGLPKEFTLSIVEGPSTISYRMVPGRALSPPGAFWFQ